MCRFFLDRLDETQDWVNRQVTHPFWCCDRKVLNRFRRGFGVEVNRATTKDMQRIFEKERG